MIGNLVRVALIGALAIGASPAAGAQTAPGGAWSHPAGQVETAPDGLTPEALVAAALASSDDLAALEARATAAEANVRLARLAWTPRFDVGAVAQWMSVEESGSLGTLVGAPGAAPGPLPADTQLYAFELGFPTYGHSYALQASMVVPISEYLLRIPGQQEMAAQAAQRASDEGVTAAAGIRLQAEALYWQWFAALGQSAIANDSMQTVLRLVEVLEVRAGAGAVGDGPLVQAQARLARAALEAQQADQAVQVAREQIRVLMGAATPPSAPGVGPEGDATWVPATLDEAVALALAERPEFVTLEATTAIARERVDQAGIERWPSLAAVAEGYTTRPWQRVQPAEDRFGFGWTLTLQLGWSPNDMVMTVPRRRSAEADLLAVESQTASTRESVELDVVSAWWALQGATAALETAESGLALSTRALALQEAAWEAGAVPVVDVLDAESERSRAALSTLLAQVQREIALSRLAWALGLGAR